MKYIIYISYEQFRIITAHLKHCTPLKKFFYYTTQGRIIIVLLTILRWDIYETKYLWTTLYAYCILYECSCAQLVYTYIKPLYIYIYISVTVLSSSTLTICYWVVLSLWSHFHVILYFTSHLRRIIFRINKSVFIIIYYCISSPRCAILLVRVSCEGIYCTQRYN